MFSSAIQPPVPLPPPQPPPPQNDAPIADIEEETTSPTSSPREPIPAPSGSPFHINFDAVHCLIKLTRQESRHHWFVLRSVHHNHLRHKRRKIHPPPFGFPKLRSFISRGRTCLRIIAHHINQLFRAFKTSAINLARMLASAFPFPTWHPTWKRCHHLLHCHTNVFSFTNGDTEPGPARFDTDSIPKVLMSVPQPPCPSTSTSSWT